MRRGAVSFGLVLAVMFLFQIYGIVDAVANYAAKTSESVLAQPACLLAGDYAARSYSVSSSIFGAPAAIYYDYGKTSPDYRVKQQGADFNVVVSGVENNYSCLVRIP